MMNKLVILLLSACCLLMTACDKENDETAQGFRIMNADVDLAAGGGTVEVALQAAERAYAWAEAHPQALYHQDLLNKQYQPAVVTGAYGDRSADDEFFWAASELYLATGKLVYREQVKKHLPTAYKTPSWGNTTALGKCHERPATGLCCRGCAGC